MSLSKINGEWIFIGFVALISLIFLIESFEFERRGTYMFPRVMAVSVLFLCGLIAITLLRRSNKSSFIGDNQKEEQVATEDSVEVPEKEDQINEQEVLITLGMFTAFIGLIYFIGFMLSSVLYAATYILYHDYGTTKKKIAVLMVLTLLIYAAHIVLDIDILSGMVFEFVME